MAFEAFMAQRRAPRRTPWLGYLLALLAHVAALALFAAAPRRSPHPTPPHTGLDDTVIGRPVRLWGASAFAAMLPPPASRPPGPADVAPLHADALVPEGPPLPRSHQGHHPRNARPPRPLRPLPPPRLEARTEPPAPLPTPAPETAAEEPMSEDVTDERTSPAEAAAPEGPAAPPPAAPSVVAAQPALDPPYIPAETARGLRVYERYPDMPEALVHRGSLYPLLVGICVSAHGAVTSVSVLQSATPDLDQVVVDAIHSWRYLPFTFDGVALPFCHTLKIVYSVPS
jgi:protein TonB